MSIYIDQLKLDYIEGDFVDADVISALTHKGYSREQAEATLKEWIEESHNQTMGLLNYLESQCMSEERAIALLTTALKNRGFEI